MNDDGANPPQPLTDAKKAAIDFLEKLTDSDRSNIISFASNAKIEQALGSSLTASKNAINNLAVLPSEERGRTNIGDAIRLARKEFEENRRPDDRTPSSRFSTVLLTDGKANAPQSPGGEPYAQEQATLLKAQGISLYTIGLGSGVHATFLKEIATEPSYYYPASSRKDLARIYANISDAICERGVTRIEITPRTSSELIPAAQ